MKTLQEVVKDFFEKKQQLRKVVGCTFGDTAAPGYRARCLMADRTRLPYIVNEAYAQYLAPAYDELAEILRRELAARPPFRRGRAIGPDELWLWGGPTPEWGGSMDPDALVKNAAYYGAQNGVYVYGPINEEMIARQASMKRVLAMVNKECRAPGQQPESDPECAENLSRLSLKYPNIVGGMMDDMTSHEPLLSDKTIANVAAVSAGLKKHNHALELYGVVYRHELGVKDFAPLQPYLDGVNLWFWNQEELLEVVESVELCRNNFPGKKILLGLFIHDYGRTDAGTVPELLLHELKAARQMLADGLINGLVILGDREILKWPEQAAVVKGFLDAQ